MHRSKLNFRHNIGDAILLSDGRRGIITHYGIYDDQYWCEVSDADGINLGAADWFSTVGCPPTISRILPAKDAKSLAHQLKSAVLEADKKYGTNFIENRYGPLTFLYG